MKKMYISFAVVIIVMIMLSSCEHKELCYSHPHTVSINVVFDWRNAPDARPETMSVYLFPENGGGPLRYEFVDIAGGTIEVPPGEYKGLCVNSDTEKLNYRGSNNWDTFEIYSRPTELLRSLGMSLGTAPRANGTEQEEVVMEAEQLFTHRVTGIEIRMGVEQTITFYPAVSVSTYTYEIINAKNLQYVIGMSGSISGMAGGMFIGEGTLADSPSMVPFGSRIVMPSTVNGGFLTFGYNPHTSHSHQLVIYAVMSDNSKWYYSYDVTDQVRNAPDPYRVHIVLDGLPLPKPLVNGGGGFNPEVDDWGSVEEEIEM